MGFLKFLAGSFGKLLGALFLFIGIIGFLGSGYIAQHYGGTTEQYMIVSVFIFVVGIIVVAAGKYVQREA